MTRWQWLAVVVWFFSAGMGQIPKSLTSEEFSVKTPEGFILWGKIYVPEKTEMSKAKKVMLLLHQWNKSQEEWVHPYGVVQQFLREGFVVLTYDFRGHGKSIKQITQEGEKTFTASKLGKEHVVKFPEDTAMILAFVRHKYFEKESGQTEQPELWVTGASIGANAGLVFAALDPKVRGVTLLSPGLEYHGLTIVEAAEQYAKSQRPAFWVAAEDDAYSARTLNSLQKALEWKEAKFLLFPKGGHGWDLFRTQPDLFLQIRSWMRTVAPKPADQIPFR